MRTGVLAEGDVKTAYAKGLERFSIKIASGFFRNQRLELPTSTGLLI